MNDLLWKYMEDRLRERGYLPTTQRGGPVVTISREAGCSANPLARELLSLIKAGKYPENPSWKIVNKEIVQVAAEELQVPPDKIEYVFKAEERKLFDEVIGALSSRYYKSDTKIRKTIMKVIRSIIDDGYVIMVGRGGVAFTKDKPNAIDILLQAPKDWRVKNVVAKYGIEPDKASKMIDTTDRERRLLVEFFYGKDTSPVIYDLIINVATFDIPQTARMILHLMEEKKMI